VAGDLRASRARLARAKKSLDDLVRRVDAFIEDDPYRIDIEPAGRRPGAIKATFRVIKDLPDEWELDVSEIGHHLRAALDNLVYQLVIDNGHDPDTSRTQFPIFADERTYCVRQGKRPAHREAMLENVAKRNKILIDQFQPYQAGPRQARRHPLWLLKLISDRDKHKTTHAALAIVGEPHVELTSPLVDQTVRVAFPPRPADDGTELFHIAPSAEVGTEIGDIDADVVLVFGTYHVDVDDLDRIARKVAEIIDRCEPRLGPNQRTTSGPT
jgi:hypothetical protein